MWIYKWIKSSIFNNYFPPLSRDEIKENYTPPPETVSKPEYGLNVANKERYNFDELKHMKNVKMMYQKRYTEYELNEKKMEN